MFFQKLFGSDPLPSVPQSRGLYYTPESGEVYQTHRAWAGRQNCSPESFTAVTLAYLNPVLHHCRIGKITLKHAS